MVDKNWLPRGYKLSTLRVNNTYYSETAEKPNTKMRLKFLFYRQLNAKYSKVAMQNALI